jgi:hypothetical protein
MVRYENDERQARATLLGSAVMSMVSVALILMALLVWYPRSVS